MQRPSLRHRLRGPVVAALRTVAAGLLALAALDYLAYDFVHLEILAHELRRHAQGPHFWWTRDVILGRAAVVLAGAAVVALLGACLLHRVRRLARGLWAVAAAATALLVLTILATSGHTRADLDGFERDPATGALWHAERHDLRWEGPRVHAFALTLLAATLPVLALVAVFAVRRPHTWRLALAAAVPATLAAGALASLWRTHGHLAPVGHEAWVADVQAARALVLGSVVALVALQLLVRARPARTTLALAPPAALLAIGVAAVALTAPHRRVIDTLYPLPATTAHPLGLRDRGPQRPWDLELPPATTCKPAPADPTLLVIRDANNPTLQHRGTSVPLARGAAALYLHEYYRDARYTHLALLVDRRVPMSALTSLLTDLPPFVGFTLTVVGAATVTIPSVDGPVIKWQPCARGRLQIDADRLARLPAAATWGDIVDDPTLVQP